MTVRCRVSMIAVAVAGLAVVAATVTATAGAEGPAVRRVAGANRFATAGQLASHAEGSTLWLATGLAFPDALTAAATGSGPVLLAAGDTAPQPTLAAAGELEGIERVRAIGGRSAVGDEALQAVAEAAGVTDVGRVAGAHRFATAAVVSRRAHPDGADVAYVATGSGFADALTASVAAAEADAPVLLAAGDELPRATRAELERLEVGQAVVVGGPAAVSPAVEDDLAEVAGDVTRVAGADRFATAAAVSAHRDLGSAEEAFVATGEDFPDVLAAAPAATAADAALLLTRQASLPRATRDELERLDVERATVAGGKAAVSAPVAEGIRERVAWDVLPDAPIAPRYGHVLAEVGDELVVWGGMSKATWQVSATGAAFDPQARTWREIAPAPGDVEPFGAEFAAGDGKLLVAGGTATPGARGCQLQPAIYHADADRWETLPDPGLGERCGAAVAFDGQRFHLWGGAHVPHSAPDEAFADGATYDPATGEWTPIPAAPIGGRAGAHAVATSEQLIVAGGTDSDAEPRADTAAYDLAAGQWRELEAMPVEPRFGAVSAQVGDELVLAGGMTSDELRTDGAALSLSEGTWRKLGDDLPSSHVALVAASGDGKVYAVGGHAERATSDVVVYDPAADAWQRLPGLPRGGRSNHQAVHTGDELIVWGGMTEGGEFPPGVTLDDSAGPVPHDDQPETEPVGRSVVTASRDGEAHRLDATGQRTWSYTGHQDDVAATAVDAAGHVYTASWDEEVHKLAPDGQRIWTYTGHRGSGHRGIVSDVAVDADGHVYTSSGPPHLEVAGEVHKLTPDGERLWAYTGHDDQVSDVAVGADGAVYTASAAGEVHKLSPDGERVWAYTGHDDVVAGVTVDDTGAVSTASVDGEMHRLTPDGERVWAYHTEDGAWGTAVAAGADGHVYLGTGLGTVHKVDGAGRRVWVYGGHDDHVNDVTVDAAGAVHTASADGEAHTLTADGERVWAYTGHTQGVVDVSPGPR